MRLSLKDILEKLNNDNFCTRPLHRPVNGTVYIYHHESNSHYEDWRIDGYSWINRGTSQIPIVKPKLKKYRFYSKIGTGKDVQVDAAFRRLVYRRLVDGVEDKSKTLVHYTGESQLQHENCTVLKTLPSVLNQMKEDMTNGTSAKELYRYYKCDEDIPKEQKTAFQPRNLKQVQNLRHAVTSSRRIGHDAIYNLYELGLETESFVKQMQLLPNLAVVLAYSELCEEIDSILQICDLSHRLSYSTGFATTDGLVATLTAKLPIFQEDPVIPIMFLFYNHNVEDCDGLIFAEVARSLPSVAASKIPIVLNNDEDGAGKKKKSRRQFLPSLMELGCWSQSESISKSLMDLSKRKEVPLDMLSVSLYRYCQHLVNEVRRGLCGSGQYVLKPELSDCLVRPPSKLQLERIQDEAELIERLRASLPVIRDAPDIAVTPAEDVHFDSETGGFLVRGLNKVHRVQFRGTRCECSCPSSQACTHILAVKKKLGMSLFDDAKNYNVTRLIHNIRGSDIKPSRRVWVSAKKPARRKRTADRGMSPLSSEHFEAAATMDFLSTSQTVLSQPKAILSKSTSYFLDAPLTESQLNQEPTSSRFTKCNLDWQSPFPHSKNEDFK